MSVYLDRFLNVPAAPLPEPQGASADPEALLKQLRLLDQQQQVNQAGELLARYLAAHAPTVRAQGQTYQIALRLHRGERLFDDG